MTEKKQFARGTVIFREGQLEICIYDIISGKVGIFANYGKPDEKLLTELEAGKSFGEMGFIEIKGRSATAVALEDTCAAVIDNESFAVYFENQPEKVLEICRNMSSRLRELSEEYVDTCRTITEYVEAEAGGKPGLFKRICRYLTVSEEYAQAYAELQSRSAFTNIGGPSYW